MTDIELTDAEIFAAAKRLARSNFEMRSADSWMWSVSCTTETQSVFITEAKTVRRHGLKSPVSSSTPLWTGT